MDFNIRVVPVFMLQMNNTSGPSVSDTKIREVEHHRNVLPKNSLNHVT